MKLPNPLMRSLGLVREQGGPVPEVNPLMDFWVSARMVVMNLATTILLAEAMKSPPLTRLLAQCASEEMLGWLLRAIVAVGTGECCSTLCAWYGSFCRLL
jgi:hypothetical protein